ncbi:MAG: hypothetical protein Q9224_005345, partial [Gallowayella concinna]
SLKFSASLFWWSLAALAMSYVTASRILFIDAHDSFTNNIISLLETRLAAVHVTVIKIDEQIPDLSAFLRDFDAVVAGPGPGHPGNPADVGLIAELWQLNAEDVIPVLGVCLGFQSLMMAFGGTVVPLPEPRHGMVRKVTPSNTSVLNGVTDISPVQYHSLYARADFASGSDDFDLEPLAWDFEAHNDLADHVKEHRSNPKAILMAVKHRTKPFYGIQYHPESICSDEASQQIVDNWWAEARQWNRRHKRETRFIPFDKQYFEPTQFTDPLTHGGGPKTPSLRQIRHHLANDNPMETPAMADQSSSPVISQALPLDGLSVPLIWDILQLGFGDVVVLDAESNQRAETGTHSIIGLLGPTTLKLEYSIGSDNIKVRQGPHSHSSDLAPYVNGVFGYLKAFMEDRRAVMGDPNVPFWGGLVGYISYEACLETIDIPISGQKDRPDISFAFIERSIVIDHQGQQVHVQSIKPEDAEWVAATSSSLTKKIVVMTRQHHIQFDPFVLDSIFSHPDRESYTTKIRKCQDYIHSGESYELCLTDQAAVDSSHLRHPWALYLYLRSLNAAPFAAYMRLDGMTLLSSSPERFMRWTRPAASDTHPAETKSTVQFRPIKGTVKRYPDGPDSPAITLEEATALLATPKERAENLMIVDLIRHDLHGVVGSGNVCVPKLMVVEEYATLFQLVTVVEGTLTVTDPNHPSPSNVPSLTTSSQNSPSISPSSTPPSTSTKSSVTSHDQSHPYDPTTTTTTTTTTKQSKNNKTGIDVLAASLPPGSMTGAPKRRSCALLRQIEEEKPRGIYSGVVDYMDVGGGGDFSVVIRSAFRWDDETYYDDGWREKRNMWTVGA